MADSGPVSVTGVEVRIESRLEWSWRFVRRSEGGRGLGGTDGVGEGEMNPGGRDISSEAERSRDVRAGVNAGFTTVVEAGAAIGLTSIKLDVFGCDLETEGEGFGGRDKAGFAVGLLNGCSIGTALRGSLGVATGGRGAGGVVVWFTGGPASLPELFATGDPHPPVLSLTGDPQPPASA